MESNSNVKRALSMNNLPRDIIKQGGNLNLGNGGHNTSSNSLNSLERKLVYTYSNHDTKPDFVSQIHMTSSFSSNESCKQPDWKDFLTQLFETTNSKLDTTNAEIKNIRDEQNEMKKILNKLTSDNDKFNARVDSVEKQIIINKESVATLNTKVDDTFKTITAKIDNNQQQQNTNVNEVNNKFELITNDNKQHILGLQQATQSLNRGVVENTTKIKELKEHIINDKQETILELGKIRNEIKTTVGSSSVNSYTPNFFNQGFPCHDHSIFKLKFNNFKKHDPKEFVDKLRSRVAHFSDWAVVNDVIYNSLEGEALSWFKIKKVNFNNFNDFEREFKKTYCEGNYREYLISILNNSYIDKTFQSPAEYLAENATKIITSGLLDESSTTQIFANHFGESVHMMALNRKAETISELFTILELIGRRKIIQDLGGNRHHDNRYNYNNNRDNNYNPHNFHRDNNNRNYNNNYNNRGNNPNNRNNNNNRNPGANDNNHNNNNNYNQNNGYRNNRNPYRDQQQHNQNQQNNNNNNNQNNNRGGSQNRQVNRVEQDGNRQPFLDQIVQIHRED